MIKQTDDRFLSLSYNIYDPHSGFAVTEDPMVFPNPIYVPEEWKYLL